MFIKYVEKHIVVVMTIFITVMLVMFWWFDGVSTELHDNPLITSDHQVSMVAKIAACFCLVATIVLYAYREWIPIHKANQQAKAAYQDYKVYEATLS